MESTFNNIYATDAWTNGSGPGSALAFNETTYIPFLQNFIRENNIKNVVDLGCGDFQCGPTIYDTLGVEYIGFDVASSIITVNVDRYPRYNFRHLDFYNEKEKLPCGDLCIIKDVLQHWPLSYINMFLSYVIAERKYKYILITNCSYQSQDNTDISIGEFHPLSSEYLPLRAFNVQSLYKYHTKEVCLLTVPS
jgi:hypothetical protein